MEKEGSSLKTHQSTLYNNFGCFYGSEIQIDNYRIDQDLNKTFKNSY